MIGFEFRLAAIASLTVAVGCGGDRGGARETHGPAGLFGSKEPGEERTGDEAVGSKQRGDEPTGPEPTGAVVYYLGRVDLGGSVPRCAWTECGFSTRVNGGGLDVALGGEPGIEFQVVIDGSPTATVRTTTGQTSHRLADTLAAGDHDVSVVRRSEALFGTSELIGFAPVAGARLVGAPAPSPRRLEVVGDSITAAYGTEGCPFSVETENGYRSYAAIAARRLGAEVHIEAWSGIGMYRDGNGSTEATMPERWRLTLPDDPEAWWDPSLWIPDAVVVNLGTNDFLLGDPGQPFVDAYVEFVRTLRSHYPGALVLCAVDGNPDVGRAIDRVVAAVDDPGVERFDLFVPDWSGCDGHPSAAAHEDMGRQLADRLEVELGW